MKGSDRLFQNKKASEELSNEIYTSFSKTCKLQNLSVELTQAQVDKILSKSIKLKLDVNKLASNENSNNRRITLNNDGTGQSRHIKNIIVDFEKLISLTLTIGGLLLEQNWVTVISFIKESMSAINIPMSKDEIYIILMIWKQSKDGQKVSDNDLYNHYQKHYVFIETKMFSKDEIHEILNRLLKLRLLNCTDGNYTVSQKVII